MRALQVESPKYGVFISTVWGIYRVVGELHRLGEVGLAPSGGRSAKPHDRSVGWSGIHQLSPPPWLSSHVDTCPWSHSPNRQKTWPASWPLVPFSLGLAQSVHVLNWRTREGDQRGGEWETIKIPRGNLAYILKLSWHVSVLTQSRPHSYKKATSPQNRVSTLKTQWKMILDASKVMYETNNQNRINKQLKTSHTFHQAPCRRDGKTTKNATRDWKTRAFDPVTQEEAWRNPAANENQQQNQITP
jgi:hypothetical protein